MEAHAKLGRPQKEALRLVAEGRSYREAAREAGLRSTADVRRHAERFGLRAAHLVARDERKIEESAALVPELRDVAGRGARDRGVDGERREEHRSDRPEEPLLVLHGAQDTRPACPPTSAPALAATSRIADCPCTAVFYVREQGVTLAPAENESALGSCRRRLVSSAQTPKPRFASGTTAAERRPAPVAKRRANLGRGFETVAIHRGAALAPGDLVASPAIIEETYTTIAVYPGWEARVDDAGDYLLAADER